MHPNRNRSKRIKVQINKNSQKIVDKIKRETGLTFSQIINELIHLSEIVEEDA